MDAYYLQEENTALKGDIETKWVSAQNEYIYSYLQVKLTLQNGAARQYYHHYIDKDLKRVSSLFFFENS